MEYIFRRYLLAQKIDALIFPTDGLRQIELILSDGYNNGKYVVTTFNIYL